MKSTKAYVLGALIVTLSLIIMGLSLTYAYYINYVENVNEGNQGVTVTSGDLTMNFATTQTISATSASLINDSDVLSTADYTAFSITLPTDAKVDSASYSLFLTDTTMTSNFKSSYLKWALYSADTLVISGDFSTATLSSTANADGTYAVSNITLLENVSISKGTTTSYKLYIWLSNDENVNQTSLLNGSLSTKVGFRAVSK